MEYNKALHRQADRNRVNLGDREEVRQPFATDARVARMGPRLQHRPMDSEFTPSPYQGTDRLDDEHIELVLRDGLAPHRCVVEFLDHRIRVALRVWGLDGKEFLVAGTRIDSLRDPSALARYLEDLRLCLSQRKLRFNNP